MDNILNQLKQIEGDFLNGFDFTTLGKNFSSLFFLVVVGYFGTVFLKTLAKETSFKIDDKVFGAFAKAFKAVITEMFRLIRRGKKV